MSPEVLLAYVAACLLLAWTPGPSMSLMLANTTSQGRVAGLWTLAGGTSGLVLLVTAAALGMTSLMAAVWEWFDVIRWIGALYLVWVGATRLRKIWRGETVLAVAIPGSARGCYAQGLAVSLSNPKVLLFLGAFLPQFVDQKFPGGPQLALLAITLVIVLGACDLCFVLAVAHTRSLVAPGRLRLMDGISGGALLLGGLALATLRRP